MAEKNEIDIGALVGGVKGFVAMIIVVISTTASAVFWALNYFASIDTVNKFQCEMSATVLVATNRLVKIELLRTRDHILPIVVRLHAKPDKTSEDMVKLRELEAELNQISSTLIEIAKIDLKDLKDECR